jgi:hypothetical protein
VAVVVDIAGMLRGQPAGEGEGEGEGAPDPCDPACVDAARLSFCADGVPTELDCAAVAVGSRCGDLSTAWGADCLLPAGAACDPDYGYGDSRCDDGLACRDAVCVAGEPQAAAPLAPTPGTTVDLGPTSTASPFGCAGCAAASPVDGVLVAVVVGLALTRAGRALRHGRLPTTTRPEC